MSGPQEFLSGKVVLHGGDSREVLKSLPDNSIDSVVTDPPYALVSIVKRFGQAGSAPAKQGRDGLYSRASAGFMGKQWDTGETAFAVEFWAQVMRVLKPGGHVVAFSGTRSYHRLVCAIEDAGFEIRDQLAWIYGSGFPKSHDVSKAIDKAAGAERQVIHERYTARRIKPGATVVREGGHGKQDVPFTATDTAPGSEEAARWQGWGTALKPAWEPIALARKPLDGTVASNVLAHGTGALNIDGCRIGSDTRSRSRSTGEKISENTSMAGANYAREIVGDVVGRWPANILHDGSAEVVSGFPETCSSVQRTGKRTGVLGDFAGQDQVIMGHDDDGGSAARFFYSAKADANDRIGSKHPAIKPVDLMQWLCRLVTPPGGVVLDPFAGTGTTGEAAWREGFRVVLIEREAEYQADIARRMALAVAGPDERRRESIKARGTIEDVGPLFGGLEAAE